MSIKIKRCWYKAYFLCLKLLKLFIIYDDFPVVCFFLFSCHCITFLVRTYIPFIIVYMGNLALKLPPSCFLSLSVTLYLQPPVPRRGFERLERWFIPTGLRRRGEPSRLRPREDWNGFAESILPIIPTPEYEYQVFCNGYLIPKVLVSENIIGRIAPVIINHHARREAY